MLVDLARTADHRADAGALGAVLLCSGRGHHGTEPGRVELLGGMSTDRRVMAYAHTYCSGQLHRPLLWSLRDAKAVRDVFRAAAGADKDGEHAVEIEDPGAGEVEIREDPTLFGDGVSLRFVPLDLADYPGRTMLRVLDGGAWPPLGPDGRCSIERDGRPVRDAHRFDVAGDIVKPFAAVATRRRAPLQVYLRHQLAPLLVQVGDGYRGALSPWAADDDSRADLPDVEMDAAPDPARWWPPKGDGALRVVGPHEPATPLFDLPGEQQGDDEPEPGQ